tara:strand:+ start:917 stop:1042 length:126 start_codon:yes stop_codon:yes gene_type:complete
MGKKNKTVKKSGDTSDKSSIIYLIMVAEAGLEPAIPKGERF